MRPARSPRPPARSGSRARPGAAASSRRGVAATRRRLAAGPACRHGALPRLARRRACAGSTPGARATSGCGSGRPVPGAGLVAGWANLRARAFGLPFGDQGLLVSRADYDAAGGYPDIPLMEDLALARALPRPRPLAAIAETGAERYRANGWLAPGGRQPLAPGPLPRGRRPAPPRAQLPHRSGPVPSSLGRKYLRGVSRRRRASGTTRQRPGPRAAGGGVSPISPPPIDLARASGPTAWSSDKRRLP